jgi:phage terminase small subunit
MMLQWNAMTIKDRRHLTVWCKEWVIHKWSMMAMMQDGKMMENMMQMMHTGGMMSADCGAQSSIKNDGDNMMRSTGNKTARTL